MKKKKIDIVKLTGLIVGGITVLVTTIYFVYSLFYKGTTLTLIVNSALIFFIGSLSVANIFIKKDLEKNIINISTMILTIFLVLFNVLNLGSTLIVNKNIVLDFNNKSIEDALKWSTSKDIKVEQIYEYSDSIPEYNIISQNFVYGTSLDEVDVLVFIVSLGPNYDKEVIIPSYVGSNIDETITSLKDMYLNNIEVEYVQDDEAAKDVIISQSVKGQIRRNTKVIFTVSLKDTPESINMIDLKNKTLFDSTLWLKRNNIKYTLNYEFSDTIKRGNVINQSKNTGDSINVLNDTITLTISKGKKIIVPDLINMTMSDITSWIINNKLKISYSDKYDTTLELGKVISSNYKQGDEIEENTTIELVISKGTLKMRTFTSLNEFRIWAQQYGILTEEVFEFNSIAKGNIIRFSKEAGAVIDLSEKIIVYVSNGNPITIPNFVGKSKSNITSTCNSLGLSCTFYYSNYSSSAKDIALSQNKLVGASVISGTSVSIGLSRGPATTYTVYFSESQLSIGNATETINTLKSYVTDKYPGVTFNFIRKASSLYDNDGFIHESSPTKDGSKVTQGQTYSIWITEN